jgi:antitoxin (DNA-binding transcriptional repressor) of toxin-antitoxin stability system
MESVNVTDLRQNLPAYLERARNGERVLITSRGVVIAELAPPTLPADAVAEIRARLKGSLLAFDRPFEPVLDPGEWDADR